MKISVHLEADNVEELLAAFASFQTSPVKQPDTVTVREQPAKTEPESARDRAEIEEPAEIVAEVPEEPEQPVEKKARKPRGPNKPKVAPVVEEPVIKPPVGPKPTIEVPQATTITRQDMLDSFAEYVQRYGMNFGYTDVSNLLQEKLGPGVRKASDVPDDALPVAVEAIRAAINDNPFNRKRDYA